MKRVLVGKVIVRRQDGKYLVLTGSDWPEKPDRSHKPDLPGGILEPGEDLYAGALRELKEEAGIQCRADELVPVYADSYYYEPKDADVLRVFFLAEQPTNDLPVELSWEHEAYRWCTAEEIQQLDFRPNHKVVVDYLVRVGVIVEREPAP